MKNGIKTLSLAGLMILGLFGNATAENIAGRYIMNNGSEILLKHIGIKESPLPDVKLSGEMDGNSLVVDLQRVRSIIFQATAGPDTPNLAHVINRSGKRFTLENPLFAMPSGKLYNNIRATTFDPIALEVKEFQLYSTVDGVLIISHSGELKVDPVSREEFPDHYIFNPYNGTELVWSN